MLRMEGPREASVQLMLQNFCFCHPKLEQSCTSSLWFKRSSFSAFVKVEKNVQVIQKLRSSRIGIETKYIKYM